MRRALQILGLIIFFLPIWSLPVGFILCILVPGNYCIATPFTWMLLWPAYFIGIAVIAIAAFVPGRKGTSDSANWHSKIVAIAALTIVFAIFGFYKWSGARSKHDESSAIEFAQKNITIRQAGGFVSGRSSLSQYTLPRSGLPTRYVIYVNAQEPFHAVLDANRKWAWGAPNFSLACLAPATLGEMDASKDECGKSRY